MSGGRPDGTAAFTDAQGSPVGSHFFGQSSFAAHAVPELRNQGFEVTIDGMVQEVSPPGPYELERGEHFVVIRSERFLEFSEQFSIAGRGEGCR